MGVFRFKHFDIVNERSAMKVNTDGVLLGASMTLRRTDRVCLDVGTGTGTIAMMAAQRLESMSQEARVIYAIDIDEPSASEASSNFMNSRWSETLVAENMSLREFADSFRNLKCDLIFSNPPYFEDSLIAPDERKSTARHTSEGLSYRDIFDFAAERTSVQGRVALVLPSDLESTVCRYARMSGFHLFRILRIRTVPRKQPSRMIIEFSKERCLCPIEEMLTIQNEGKYTQEYLSLTHDFYLFA